MLLPEICQKFHIHLIQKQQIAEQAESKKMAAVKSEGLQPQQCNQVIQLARADKSFEKKFLSYVNEVKNSPSEAD